MGSVHTQRAFPGASPYAATKGALEALTGVLRRHEVECVMHFAALAYVGESVTDPLRYYENNTAGTIRLLQAMHQAGARRLVFSSTCAGVEERPCPAA